MTPATTAGILGDFYVPADAVAAAAKVRDAGAEALGALPGFDADTVAAVLEAANKVVADTPEPAAEAEAEAEAPDETPAGS